MPKFRIEFEAGWSEKKCMMVRRDMERDLRLYGGVSHIGPLQIVTEAGEPEAPVPLLDLICTRFNSKTKMICGTEWQAPTFTNCPKCNGRFVQKKGAPKPQPELQQAADSTEVSPLEAV